MYVCACMSTPEDDVHLSSWLEDAVETYMQINTVLTVTVELLTSRRKCFVNGDMYMVLLV